MMDFISKALESYTSDFLQVCPEKLQTYLNNFEDMKMPVISVVEKRLIPPAFFKTRQRKVMGYFDKICEDEQSSKFV